MHTAFDNTSCIDFGIWLYYVYLKTLSYIKHASAWGSRRSHILQRSNTSYVDPLDLLQSALSTVVHACSVVLGIIHKILSIITKLHAA